MIQLFAKISVIFSVQGVLSKCNGNNLFRITREQILHYCGEEGNRLFSLLTVQKKRANVRNEAKTEIALIHC
jgi:hypothetical protein